MNFLGFNQSDMLDNRRIQYFYPKITISNFHIGMADMNKKCEKLFKVDKLLMMKQVFDNVIGSG